MRLIKYGSGILKFQTTSALKRIFLLLIVILPLGWIIGQIAIKNAENLASPTTKICRGEVGDKKCRQVSRTLTHSLTQTLGAVALGGSIILVEGGIALLILYFPTSLYLFDKTSKQFYFIRENLFQQKVIETHPLENVRGVVVHATSLSLDMTKRSPFFLGETRQAESLAQQMNQFLADKIPLEDAPVIEL